MEMPAVRWETHERGGFARLGTAEDRRLGPPEPPLRGLPSHWFVVCRQSLPPDLLRSWFAGTNQTSNSLLHWGSNSGERQGD